MNETLLSAVEDAGLNASAPPQQRWLDGWLLRLSPGKAKRARCINAVAEGRRPLADKLAQAQTLFAQADLPLLVRITPFSRPGGLDPALERLGLEAIDDTRVMVAPSLTGPRAASWPKGVSCHAVGHSVFAQTIGMLRATPLAQRQAHAQRLELSPVTFEGYVLRRDGDATVLACGQMVHDQDLVGLYDVFTTPAMRGQGWASQLCRHLLGLAQARGARVAYLQVESDNDAARSVYRGLGFVDAYAYHYRARGVDPANPSPAGVGAQ